MVRKVIKVDGHRVTIIYPPLTVKQVGELLAWREYVKKVGK